ncbi:MAG: Smr/MutS family protein [Planctomycetota bacterium]
MSAASNPIDEIFVDLHGLVVAEAVPAMQTALERAFHAKTRRVIFVHGRGNHSDGDAPLGRKAREFLKSLSDTPYSCIRKLEFGEHSAELNHNDGCVRVWLALQLSRDQVKFTPQPLRNPELEPDRKTNARRTDLPPGKKSLQSLSEVEEELRKRFGAPGLSRDYRPADPRKGEWPGQR